MIALALWRPGADIEGHLAFVPSTLALAWAGASDAAKTLRGAARWYRIPVRAFVGTLACYLLLGVAEFALMWLEGGAFSGPLERLAEVRFSLFLGLVLGAATAVVGVVVIPLNRFALGWLTRRRAGPDSGSWR